MQALIARLIERGNAYASRGDVYFAVRSFPAYGKLSKRQLEDLRAGARVEPGEQKRDPLDFALWKAAKPGEPASVTWESPWGPGRPGWHIECSAMCQKLELLAHRRALDVPAGPAGAPGALPGDGSGLPGLGGLPEGEIERVPLLLAGLHAGARAQVLELAFGELSVSWKR